MPTNGDVRLNIRIWGSYDRRSHGNGANPTTERKVRRGGRKRSCGLSAQRRTSLATGDDAAVSIIARHACPACPVSGSSSVGRGQRRKGGAKDDRRGKCDLCHIGHLSYLLR